MKNENYSLAEFHETNDVFYYNKDYLPPIRKAANKFLPDYQPKSGTAIAFEYAKAKKKRIVNLFEQSY